MSAPTPLEVVAGILVEDGRILVARRLADAHLGGFWEFPGGKVEPGESPEEALERELFEELGIQVHAGARWGILAHQYPERAVLLRFHFVERTAGEPRALGCEEFRWARPSELLDLEFPAADRPLVEALIRAEREGMPSDRLRRIVRLEEPAGDPLRPAPRDAARNREGKDTE